MPSCLRSVTFLAATGPSWRAGMQSGECGSRVTRKVPGQVEILSVPSICRYLHTQILPKYICT